MNYDSQSEARKSVKLFFLSELKRALNNENIQIAKEASNLASGDFFYLTITFYLPIPDSLTDSKRNVFLWGLKKHTKKPDLSNLVKFYEDAANEILFPDDKMIVSIKTDKHYSEKPRTEIDIMAKKQTNDSDVEAILSVYSPEKFQELHNVFLELNHAFNVASGGSEKVAHLLSELADGHADLLKKIKTKCPGYWRKKQKAENFDPSKEEKVIPIKQQDFFYLT